MLRGSGCKWRKCRFCDYHLDSSKYEIENIILNKKILEKVTGKYGVLEVINSGSFLELGETLFEIMEIAIQKNIKEISFEAHWNDKNELREWRNKFQKNGIKLFIKTGVESFDYLFRESYLMKGIPNVSALEISKYFDDCCLLFGIPGQSIESMKEDIELGKKYFRRVCINIMQENTTNIKPDIRVIKNFKKYIYDEIKNDENIDVLLENTDFGVGGCKENE